MKGTLKNILLSIGVLSLGLITYKIRTVPTGAIITTPPTTYVSTETNAPTDFQPPKVTVHLAGAVHSPGVYYIPIGTRTLDALNHAGGATPLANLDKVNLAKKVKDGQRIFVPFMNQKATKKTAKPVSVQTPKACVTVNQATQKDLEGIPGIGPKTAQEIVRFRQKNGSFKSISSLQEVRYIGPKLIQKIRPFICPF